MFPELDISPMNLKNEKEKTVAWSDQGNYYIVRTSIDSTTGKQKFLRRIILERDGKIVKNERKTFDPSSEDLIRYEITDISNEKIIQTVKIPKPSNEKEFIETKRTYVFGYHSEYRKDLDKFLWELEIQKNTRFLDPLTLESALFFPDQYRLDRLDFPKSCEGPLSFILHFRFMRKEVEQVMFKSSLDDILRVKPFEKTVPICRGLRKK